MSNALLSHAPSVGQGKSLPPSDNSTAALIDSATRLKDLAESGLTVAGCLAVALESFLSDIQQAKRKTTVNRRRGRLRRERMTRRILAGRQIASGRRENPEACQCHANRQPVHLPGWLETVPRLDDRDFCRLFIVHADGQRLVAATVDDARAIVARLSPQVAARARIQAMAAVVHEGIDAPADARLMVVGVNPLILDTLKARCEIVGVSFPRLVSGLLLSWLRNMTPTKTGESLVRELGRWESGRRRFHDWPAGTANGKEVAHVA